MMRFALFNRIYLFLFLLFFMTGCDLVVGIFEAGFWVGIFIVVAIAGLIFWLFNKIRK